MLVKLWREFIAIKTCLRCSVRSLYRVRQVRLMTIFLTKTGRQTLCRRHLQSVKRELWKLS